MLAGVITRRRYAVMFAFGDATFSVAAPGGQTSEFVIATPT